MKNLNVLNQTQKQEELKEINELKFKYAYIEGCPITSKEQMLRDINICAEEADDIVKETAEEHKKNAILSGANINLLNELEKKLCSFAGDLLCFAADEYAELILEHGQLWYGDTMYLEEMQIGKCHSNSIKVNEENPECPIVVGYALSSYGFWFAHTWLLAKEDDEKSYYVLETTVPAILYFGVVLTKSKLLEFKELYS